MAKQTKRFVITNKNLYVTIFLILYRLTLDLCYFEVISPSYSYAGFKDNSTFYLIILSWILTFAFIPFVIYFINKPKAKVSEIFVLFCLLLSFFPFTTLICSGILSMRFIVMNTVYCITLIGFQLLINRHEPRVFMFKNDSLIISYAMVKGMVFFSALLVIFVSAMYTSFRLNFNLSNVYELRGEHVTANLPGVIGYMFSWTRMLNNLFLMYALIKRKRGLTMALIFVQLLSFGIDGMKTVFFMIFIILLLNVSYKSSKFVSYKSGLIWGLIGLNCLGMIEKRAFDSSFIISALQRRVMFVPAYLGNCYVDFFSMRTPDYFRGSFLRYFGFKTPYPNLACIIGDIYFNKPLMNCNNGLISDAVTNFGTAGIILMPLILVLVLRLIDMSTKDLNEKIIIFFAFQISLSLINTALCTSLLTHGIMITTLAIMFLRSDPELAGHRT